MLHEALKTVVEHSHAVTMAETGGTVGAEGAVVFTSTGVKYIKNIEAPIKILKWGFVVSATALVTGGSSLIMKLNTYPNAGSASGKTVVDTLTIADPNSAYTLGKGAYRDPYTASTKSTTPASQPTGFGPVGVNAPDIEAGQAQIILSAGQMLSIEVTTAATTSGAGELFIEYELLPVSKPSGYGTTDAGTVSLTEALTRLAS